MSDSFADKCLNVVAMVLIPLIVVGPVVAFGYRSNGSFANYRDAKSWDETEGEVLSTSIRRCRGASFRKVYYRYYYEGKRHFSDRVDFSETGRIEFRGPSPEDKQFAVGSKVKVFVDPRDPTSATLYRGVSYGMLVDFAGLFVFGVGLISILSFMSHVRSQRRRERDAVNGFQQAELYAT